MSPTQWCAQACGQPSSASRSGGDVVAEAPLEALDQRIEPGLRLGHAEVAVRLARAGDRATADRIGAEGQAGCLLDRRASRVDVRRRDRGEDDVLLAGDAEVAADPLGDVGQSEHLVTGEQADVDRDPERDDALFVLGSDAEVVGARAGVGRQLEVRQGVPEPALQLCAHPLRADVVDHELEPRLDPRDAIAQVFLPGVEQRAQHRERLVDAHEDAELAGEPWDGREPTADEDAEAVLAVADAADQRDAVDLGRVAAVGARGDRDLVLPRQVRVVGVPVEEARHVVQHGSDVEELVPCDARERAAGGVADGVAAAARGRQADPVELGEDVGQRGEREVVELDRLTGRQLPGALAVLVGEARRRRGAGPG